MAEIKLIHIGILIRDDGKHVRREWKKPSVLGREVCKLADVPIGRPPYEYNISLEAGHAGRRNKSQTRAVCTAPGGQIQLSARASISPRFAPFPHLPYVSFFPTRSRQRENKLYASENTENYSVVSGSKMFLFLTSMFRK